MTGYIALIRKTADSDYGVDFPDFPGCITAGRSLDEARIMAAEALSFHMEGMTEDGEAVPPPSGLDAIMGDPENKDTVAVLIEGAGPSRSVRISVMLPHELVERIDRSTRDRSVFLAEAARAKLDLASSG